MKLVISRNDLADMMSKGGTTAERVSVIPILKHVRLVAGEGVLRVSTTNLNMQAEAVGGAAIDTPGATTVDAEKLKTIVDRLPRGSDILLTLEGDNLIVKSGRVKSRLPTLPVTDWPNLDGKLQGDVASFTVSGHGLDRLIARPSGISGLVDGTRANLQGVFLHRRHWRNEDCLCAVATNGHTLLLTSIDCPDGAEALPTHGNGETGILIPQETAAAALKLFRSEEAVHISTSRTRIIFEGSTSRLASKLADAVYPDYRRILPEPSENLIRADRADCIARVSLLETFATKEHGHKLEAAPAETGLALAASGGAEGDAYAVAEAECEGNVPTFGLSSQYLKIMLGAFKAETLTISVRDAGDPLLFTADNEKDTLGVVMPMRVSGFIARGGIE